MFPAILLLLLVAAYRVVLGVAGQADTAAWAWAHNFSPLAAVALCGAIYLPRRLAVMLPLGALFLSDLGLNYLLGVGLLGWWMVPQYLALGLVSGLGFRLRGGGSWGTLVGASLASSLLFYLIANTGSWLALPEYPRTLAGWLQAQTAGLPGFSPAWTFLRNSAGSDLLFTALFVASQALGRLPEGERAGWTRAGVAGTASQG